MSTGRTQNRMKRPGTFGTRRKLGVILAERRESTQADWKDGSATASDPGEKWEKDLNSTEKSVSQRAGQPASRAAERSGL